MISPSGTSPVLLPMETIHEVMPLLAANPNPKQYKA